MNSERLINIIITVLVFVLFFSIWGGCICLWIVQYLRKVRSARARLGIDNPENNGVESNILRLWYDSHQDDAPVESSKETTLSARMKKIRSQTGWHASIRAIVLRVLAMVVLVFIATCFLGGGIIMALGASVTTVFMLWCYIQNTIVRRTALFERQLADALGISSRALRAGHPLVGTFQLIADEIGEPLGNVFSQICQEQSLGLGLKDSIRRVAETTYNSELKLFATAIAIQFQSGGNLANLMDRLASVIRARMRLNRRIRVITAQTQFSKKVLIALPIVLFFLLNVVNAEYMLPFYTTIAGKIMLVIGGASILLGSWMMNRLSVIRL